MRILIIGGSRFMGRFLTEAALENGHTVTLFNRGKSNPVLSGGAEKLIGDREKDLSALAGREWDAVVDMCGFVPSVMTKAIAILRKSVKHYTFISSISAYADTSKPGITENAPLAALPHEEIVGITSARQITSENYGPLKVLCEEVVEAGFPHSNLIIRPGLIVGPNDPSDRFTYWPVRVAEGGEVLAPGTAGGLVQFIDARDLANWTLHMVEAGKTGAYSATGPDYELGMGQLLETCRVVSGSNATFNWVEDKFLLDEAVAPWADLPLWLPDTDENKGFNRVNCAKAFEAGLFIRPLADTVRATLDWVKTLPADRQAITGITREKEAELLQKWRGAN